MSGCVIPMSKVCRPTSGYGNISVVFGDGSNVVTINHDDGRLSTLTLTDKEMAEMGVTLAEVQNMKTAGVGCVNQCEPEPCRRRRD